MSDNYIKISSVEDIDITLDLIVEFAKNPGKELFYWGGIVMPLPEEKQFESFLQIRNMNTRKMEFVPVIIKEAFCGLTLDISSAGNYSFTCSALDIEEGYFTGGFPNTFIAATTDVEVVRIALKRFFSLDSFEDQEADPLTGSVIPKGY